MDKKYEDKKYVVGMIGTNCYLVINEETKESVMVDPELIRRR